LQRARAHFLAHLCVSFSERLGFLGLVPWALLVSTLFAPQAVFLDRPPVRQGIHHLPPDDVSFCGIFFFFFLRMTRTRSALTIRPSGVFFQTGRFSCACSFAKAPLLSLLFDQFFQSCLTRCPFFSMIVEFSFRSLELVLKRSCWPTRCFCVPAQRTYVCSRASHDALFREFPSKPLFS